MKTGEAGGYSAVPAAFHGSDVEYVPESMIRSDRPYGKRVSLYFPGRR